jgi:integrase
MARGSITPRPTKDGKVRYRVKWESRGADGSRRHHSATRATKKAAEALLAEKLDEVNEGVFVVASKETLSAYLERWLETSAHGWTEATLYQYQSTIKRRITPLIGHIPLGTLDELAIQHCYAQLTAKGYENATVAGVHKILNAALGSAVSWRLLPRNPTDGVKAPAPVVTAPTTWSADEAAAFIAGTRNDPLGPMWRLGLDAGMRVGEILALAWRDLDTERGIVAVRRTLTRTGGGGWKIGEHGKTTSSRRAIHLDTETVAALRALRPAQNERRLACGAAWVDLDLIFDRGDGKWINQERVRTRFADAVKRTKVPEITPHGMRHTMATLMLGAGVHPKMVQERLGHSSIQMTLDRYSHVTMTMQEDAAAVIGEILRGGARPGRGHETG